MAAIKRENKAYLFASDVDDSEAEAREIASDFFEMTDYVFNKEWVAAVLEIMMRRDDLSVRDMGIVLAAVRERYRKCPERWNKIAYELSKPPLVTAGAE